MAFIVIIILGCKPKIKEQQSQQPKPRSIHYAAMIGDVNSLEEFLKAGVGVDTRDKFSASTPLHFAERKEIAQILVARGADVNATNKAGITPLMCAMMGRGDCKEIAEILIAHGANINAQDSAGRTPLHGAVLNGQPNMVVLLLAKGADVNVRMNNGKTPLDFAISLSQEHFRFGSPMAAKKKDFEECVKLLQQHGTK
jgi:ankyrin repeat protein